MRVIFTVGNISLADTPVGCRRGVIFLERGDQPSWRVVIYDPRPECFREAIGLELPFSARISDGTQLTGWVRVGPGEDEVGVRCLQGIGRLGARRPWHTLPRHLRRSLQAGDPLGPYAGQSEPSKSAKELVTNVPAPRRMHLPAVIRNLSSGQRRDRAARAAAGRP